MMYVWFFEGYGDHRDLHVLTHSFPTRRSSDLALQADRHRDGRGIEGGAVGVRLYDPPARRVGGRSGLTNRPSPRRSRGEGDRREAVVEGRRRCAIAPPSEIGRAHV